MIIKNFAQANEYLYAHIPSTTSKEFPGEVGLQRMRRLMSELGDPQEQLNVIHIAGTSGKGSTAHFITTALISQGNSVGTHLSPHIQDIRERCMINNSFIDENTFISRLNDIVPAVKTVSSGSLGVPTYFEILVAMAYYTFYKASVDFAVIETGLGGLYDGTNVVSNPNKYSVITQIGKDHTKILGNTLALIASQKAGIIHPGNHVIALWQHASVRLVISEAVRRTQAKLEWVRPEENYHIDSVSPKQTNFYFQYGDTRIPVTLGTPGIHQAQNAAVALTTVFHIASHRNMPLNLQALQESLTHSRFPGRMDIQIHDSSTVILDGAHNPQKMKELLRSLQVLYPHMKFDFLLSFKTGKDASAMLSQIAPLAHNITVAPFFTQGQDMKHFSQDPKYLAERLRRLGVIRVTVTSSPSEGLTKAMQKRPKILIITGSLYFLSEMYPLLSHRKVS